MSPDFVSQRNEVFLCTFMPALHISTSAISFARTLFIYVLTSCQGQVVTLLLHTHV